VTLKQAAENAASCMGEKKGGRVNAKEMVMNWMIVLAVVLSVAVGSCAPTKPAIVGTGAYQVIDLGVHPGFESSEPTGINSVGQVSGFSSRNSNPPRRALTARYAPSRFLRACSGI
jgi:hypothetical protein